MSGRAARVLAVMMAAILVFAVESEANVFGQLPAKVKVGKRTYSITYESKVEEGKLWGICYLDDKKIAVSLDGDIATLESTLIHEILHAMSHEYKLRLSEAKVRQLEAALYDVFKQNGWVIKPE